MKQETSVEVTAVVQVRGDGGLTCSSRWRWGEVVRFWVYFECGIADGLIAGCGREVFGPLGRGSSWAVSLWGPGKELHFQAQVPSEGS